MYKNNFVLRLFFDREFGWFLATWSKLPDPPSHVDGGSWEKCGLSVAKYTHGILGKLEEQLYCESLCASIILNRGVVAKSRGFSVRKMYGRERHAVVWVEIQIEGEQLRRTITMWNLDYPFSKDFVAHLSTEETEIDLPAMKGEDQLEFFRNYMKK